MSDNAARIEAVESRSGETFVFVGPTLDLATAQQLLPGAVYLPPARQGDGYRLVGRHPSRVVLIDGVFHREPSIWPRELLALLDAGVRVFGCSSMGALRAVELAPFGMIGAGTVFEWYRSGLIAADDEVALLHGDDSFGYRSLSEPLVNIRATLQRAVAERVLASGEADALVDYARALHYPERTLAALVARGPAVAWRDSRREAVRDWLATHQIDVKRQDAAALLRAIAADPDQPAPRSRFRDGPGWEYRCRGLASEREFGADEQTRESWAWSRRWFVLRWAFERGVTCPAEQVAHTEQEWVRSSGLSSVDELAHRAELTVEEARHVIRDEAQWSWLLLAGPNDGRIELPFSAAAPEEPRIARSNAYILDWAAMHGIDLPDEAGQLDLAEWIVRRGPPYFGYRRHRVEVERIFRERLVRAARRAAACA